jgi:hypothetical protein
MAQITMLTPEVQIAVCRAIRAGCDRKTAALSAGVAPITLRKWLRRGQTGEEPYASFRVAVARARALKINLGLRRILRHAKKEWRAQAWVLERTEPELFAKPGDPQPQPRPVNVGVQIDLAPYAEILRRIPLPGEPAQDRVLDHAPPAADLPPDRPPGA